MVTFNPRQMLRERAAAGSALLGTALPQPRVSPFLRGLGRGDRLFEILRKRGLTPTLRWATAIG